MDQQCLVPESDGELQSYWDSQERRVREVGGMEPRGLPNLLLQPRLAKVTHIISTGEHFDPKLPKPESLGVYARDVVSDLKENFRVRHELLAKRELLDIQKVLVISAKDEWLRRFTKFVGLPFTKSVFWLDFAAVMGPNLSGYHHNEHSVWLDNRAICQQFMEFALHQGLPAIFHTYLEDSCVHQDWLVEYLKLNPSQKFLATGFDCNGANNKRFVERRIRLLQEVENRAGRELHIVLHTMMTCIRIIKYAHDAFPKRVYLVGRSLVRDSFSGKSIDFRADGTSVRTPRDPAYRPGMALFIRNAQVHRQTLEEIIPGFFSDPEPFQWN